MNRLAELPALDMITSPQIGDGARQADDAVVSEVRQAELLHDAVEQCLCRGIENAIRSSADAQILIRADLAPALQLR